MEDKKKEENIVKNEDELNEEDLKISEDEGFSDTEKELDRKISNNIIEINDETALEKGSANYDSSDLTVLDGLEAVRMRPGMYIGTTSVTGLHHLVWEIVDNGIDEALAGYCDRIDVTINQDNSITVVDNGRGIPVDMVEKTGLSGVETVYTVLHAGGKFGYNDGYKFSGGLHGVGASVVNGLSSWCEVTVYRDGGEYYIRFENGGHIVEHLRRVGDSSLHGTKVTFKPDPTIFTETTEFNYDTILTRLRQMAFLNKGITITLTDKRVEPNKHEEFCYKGGIIEYVDYLDRKSEKLVDSVFYCHNAQIFKDESNKYEIIVEVAMQYCNQDNINIYSFCNNVATGNGGTHVEGFNLAIARVFNNYARNNNFLKKNDKEKIVAEDCRKGLTAIISVKHPNPQYEGQTKGKLGNVEVKKIVSNVVGEALERYLNENKQISTVILTKIRTNYDYRLKMAAYSSQLKKKTGLEITTLPGKLADCSSNDPRECELFIVEGNSAGGSAKLGRDPKIQAILPLRGKILNVQKAQDHKILENAEIGNMITAIGGGYGDSFDVSKIRYHKIIIMTDADVDGSHIRILLLTFFNRFMKPLIEKGFVYIAQPPLYKVQYKGKDYYAYREEELLKIRKDLNLKDNYPMQRYKGLGEMDPDQLEETTMKPGVRKMLRVTVDDAITADSIFDELMGEEVEPRREFIRENAQFVKNLDI